jgi:hypothetical protein
LEVSITTNTAFPLVARQLGPAVAAAVMREEQRQGRPSSSSSSRRRLMQLQGALMVPLAAWSLVLLPLLPVVLLW